LKLARAHAASPLPFGPVLVLDPWERMSLAACRALGHRGHRVGIAGHRASDLAAASRFAARYDRLPDPAGPAAPYEYALSQLVAEQGYAAIISTHDATIARLATIGSPAPTLGRLDAGWRQLVDKHALASVTVAAGVRYPHSVPVTGPDDVPAAIERTGLPAFVKSGSSAWATADRVAFQRGASFVTTPGEFDAAVRALLADELPVIAQEWIAGATKLNAVVLRREESVDVRYAHRVLREHPMSGGTGIALETLDAERGDGAAAIALLERVADAAGYRGLVQAEMYRSRSDGELYLIDVNPRLWGSTWFAERLGIGIVERSLRAALDLAPLPPPSYPAGRRFHTLSGEARWLAAHPRRLHAARELAGTIRPSDTFDYVDPRDPVPTARYVARGVGELVRSQRPRRRTRPRRAGRRQDPRLGVGLVGLGSVSHYYVGAIERSGAFELTALCDRDPLRLERRGAAARGAARYERVADLLADASVDVVVVDTPVATHADLCAAALVAGRSVCCEKPLATTLEDAERLAALASERGLTLFTAFHRRYNRNLPRPSALEPAGLRTVEVRYLERIEDHAPGAGWYATPASAGGGCIVDNGPNAYDVARHLFGPASVDDASVVRSEHGVDVAATIHGSFAGGAELLIRLDWAFDGETKDLVARWDDGRELRVDLLAGFPAFKSSLEHEYDGVMAEFAEHLATRRRDEAGAQVSQWLSAALRQAGAAERAAS
jgi:predicted dehydrogenase